jgi:hypothetical protein
MTALTPRDLNNRRLGRIGADRRLPRAERRRPSHEGSHAMPAYQLRPGAGTGTGG